MQEPKTKFTPGPWRVPPCCTIHMNKPSWDENYSPLVKSGKEVVCGLSNVRVADAELIVAAPDMYKMLKRFANYFKERGFNTPRTCTLPTPEEVCNLIDEIDRR